MGFFDRVKNMFTEEVEDDVKVEQVKKDVTHVSIEVPKAKDINSNININNDINDEDTEKISFSKPVFFDDNDFKDLNLVSKEDEFTKEEKNIYGIKKELEMPVEKKTFKPTPIISPVYGVLDKNYHKEDIVSREEVQKSVEDDVEPTVDSIRNKAYGTLEDELENTLFGNNSILFKHISEDVNKDNIEIDELDTDVLTNLTDDISKEIDELLENKEKYLSGIPEKQEVTDDILDFIDSTLYKEGDED